MRNQSWMSRTPVAKLKGWMQQLRQASVKLKTYNMYIDDLYALNAAMGARRGTRRALGPVWDSHNTTWCAALLRNIAFSLVPSALAIYILKFGLKRRKKRKNLICLRCAKKVDFCMCGWFSPLWILCCGRPCTWLNLHEKENYAYARTYGVSYNYIIGAIHLVRTQRRGKRGSNALRIPMHCCHSDVIIFWNLEICTYVLNVWSHSYNQL